MTDSDFWIKFWGVRGSIACPGTETVRYGGNTTCIEVKAGPNRFVIDGGTGLREYGNDLVHRPDRGSRVDIYLTHTHWDHIAGIPFFVPAYRKDMEVHFWAGHLAPDDTIRHVLMKQMLAPLFPVPINVFAGCHFHDYSCGAELDAGPGVRMTTCPLNHPNRACGYRIEYDGKSICIITDTEHVPGTLDRAIVEFVRDADIMVYDSMYTDEEFTKFVGWGHSTWQEALRVADAANVAVAVPFHHDPMHNDAFLDRQAEEAEAIRPGTVFAREGLVLRP